MVTFFATLLVNILIGTIFYLILSLKLEKSSSQLQVKKMRREMDDIIHEFNLTAERNISLLEHKVESFRRLLEKHGIDDSIDTNPPSSAKNNGSGTSEQTEFNTENKFVKKKPELGPDKNGLLKKIGSKLMHAIQDVPQVQELPAQKNVSDKDHGHAVAHSAAYRQSKNPFIHDAPLPAAVVSADMKTAFALTVTLQEKYDLIAHYYDKGVEIDDLAKTSGIPAGEISLVVSMHSKKG